MCGPSRRLELLPYLAGSATMNGARDPGNPFDQAVNLASRTGLDLKMGLGSNLTLDAAVNPRLRPGGGGPGGGESVGI